MNLVIYHSPCYDGFASAWVFHHYSEDFADPIEYKPMNYNQEIHLTRNYNYIFVVDFSFDKDVIHTILKNNVNKKLIILDHHKTAKENLLPLAKKRNKKLDIVFDMERAGCQITWDYVSDFLYHKKIHRPKILDYIADRDLWQWKMPFSKQINMYLAENKCMTKFDKFDRAIEEWNIMSMRNQGKQLLDIQQKTIKKLINKHCYYGTIQGQSCFIVQSTMYVSEIGDYLLNYSKTKRLGVNIVCIYYYDCENGYFRFSLRSKDIDITPICREFQGGGHENAGGCMLSHDDLNRFVCFTRRMYVYA